MPNARLGPAIPVLNVRHVEDALSYYVNRLGFQVDFRYEKQPGSYAGVKRDDTRLHMHLHPAEAFANAHAGPPRFRIPVDNPDALHAEYKAMGVLDGDVEVHDTEWGTREFGFKDPDGNELVFFRIL
jgi:catechol 2,3-dioxygenase-like lactoylglutathione lyase family enzyme